MYDAIVIGGSFAGLAAAMQLARGRRSVCIVDAGLPRNRFADASHGVLGQDGANPLAMLEQAHNQVLAYPTVTIINDMAVAARPCDDGFSVEVASGKALSARRLLLASGIEDVMPDIPGLKDRWGASVIHCPYCHGYEFGGQKLGVLNTIPASIHQALIIPDWGPTTYFLNGSQPTIDEQAMLAKRNVTIEPAPVAALEGDAPALTGVRLTDGRLVEVAALFIAPTIRISPLAEQLGCELEEFPTGLSIQADPMTKETSVSGVFAAGDVSLPFGNVTLAMAAGVAAGSGVHRSLMFEGLL
jgi:thioredoxin reductase